MGAEDLAMDMEVDVQGVDRAGSCARCRFMCKRMTLLALDTPDVQANDTLDVQANDTPRFMCKRCASE